MKLKVRILIFGLFIMPLSLLTTARALEPNYAPVEIERHCGFGSEIDFKGLAYFCYDDPVKGPQLYRTNGSEDNWEPVTNFKPKTGQIEVLFKTHSELFFEVGGSLYKTSGRPGNYTKIGDFEELSFPLTHIASDAGAHFFRSDDHLYVAENNPGNVRLIGKTTLDRGLYRSDVLYFKGYLYYVDTSSFGYWNLLKRVDRYGRSELLKEFPKGSDTIIYPIANDVGFSVLNYGRGVGWHRVDSSGTVTPMKFGGAPIGKVGSSLIFSHYKNSSYDELYVTRDLDKFTYLGKSWSGSGADSGFEFDNYSIVGCGYYGSCNKVLVTNGTPSGTHIIDGMLLSNTADPKAGILVVRNANELHFMDKHNPQELEKVAELPGRIVRAYIRDSRSYYVLTMEGEYPDEVTKLWLVTRSRNAPVLLSKQRGDIDIISNMATEGQRLYFSVLIDGYTPNDKAELWHSAGTPESTYVLKNPAIELPAFGWLPAIQLLLLDDQP